MVDIPVLTLWQPWASLIALRFKTIETRSWSTKYRGPLAIHAAARVPTSALGVNIGGFTVEKDNPRGTAPAYLLRGPVEWPYRLPLGSIVATCTLVDVVPIHEHGCRCERPRSGPYLLHSGTIFRGENIVGLFDGDGAGMSRPDWGPSAADCLAVQHPRQQAPFGDFRCGRFGWLLDAVTPIKPVAFKGGQGLTRRWPVNDWREDMIEMPIRLPDYVCDRCGARNDKKAYGPGYAKVCPDCGSSDVRLADEPRALLMARPFMARSARDAARSFDESYCEYLERSEQEKYDYFAARGDHATAESMLTRTLGEALMGNDGE